MQRNRHPYNNYSIVAEMYESARVIRSFDMDRFATDTSFPSSAARVVITGEGSSMIFPGRHAMYQALSSGAPQTVFAEFASQARSFDFSGGDTRLFIASNSGRTAECVHLRRHVEQHAPDCPITGVAGAAESPLLADLASRYVLTCGSEQAVAATKSVIEQALFYDELLRIWNGNERIDRETLAAEFEQALDETIPREIADRVASAGTVYFAGRTDGVAAELALKTNEILRRKSDYLPGTYAVHGIEEVMHEHDVLIWVDPDPLWEAKFEQTIAQGTGAAIIAISPHETRFPTLRIPEGSRHGAYLRLAMGWNLLVEAGLRASIDLDTPQRSRKIGNEVTSS